MTTDATGLIRVVKAPEGEPPDDVRRAWVGLELPCLPEMGLIEDARAVISLEQVPNPYGVLVPQKLALEILAKNDPEASKWYEERCIRSLPDEEFFFIFEQRDVEILRGVTRKPLIHVTEEMMGDPGR